MARDRTPRNRASERHTVRKITRSFREMLTDGGETPASRLLMRMRDDSLDPVYRDELAVKLVGYELPRLAAIEAEVTNVHKTHEEWLAELDDGERDERRLQ